MREPPMLVGTGRRQTGGPATARADSTCGRSEIPALHLPRLTLRAPAVLGLALPLGGAELQRGCARRGHHACARGRGVEDVKRRRGETWPPHAAPARLQGPRQNKMGATRWARRSSSAQSVRGRGLGFGLVGARGDGRDVGRPPIDQYGQLSAPLSAPGACWACPNTSHCAWSVPLPLPPTIGSATSSDA
jgi:hypothetical protein